MKLEPVIVFEDGWRLVPNIGMRRVLIDAFGPDSDTWIGRRLVIDRHRMEGTAKWEKRVHVEAGPDALDGADRAKDDEPDVDDPIGIHDEDDLDAEVHRFTRSRR